MNEAARKQFAEDFPADELTENEKYIHKLLAEGTEEEVNKLFNQITRFNDGSQIQINEYSNR